MPSLLALLLAATVAAAPYRLVDSVGEPVRGATVRVIGAAASPVAVTDAEGRFRLDPEPAPPFEVAVTGPRGVVLGHARVESVSGRVLVLHPVETELVTVRGSPLSATGSSPASASTELSRESLGADRPTILADALEDVPGASNAGGGHTGVPSLRGMARGRTLVLLDDARVTAERRAGPSAGFLDPAGLASVEVVRGPGSLAYGPDGLGGVVHLRTAEPRLGEASGRAHAAFGSADESAGLFVEQSIPVGRGALLAQAHARRFDDYESPDGTVEGSAARDHGVLLRGILATGSAIFGLGVRSDRALDVGRAARADLAERTSYPKEASDRVTLSADLPGAFGADTLELRAFAGRYRLVTARETPAPAGRSIEEAHVDANDAGLRVVVARRGRLGALRFGLDGHARFGLEARDVRREIGPSGETLSRTAETSIAEARRIGGGAFVEGERSFASDRLHVLGGVRGDVVEAVNRGGFFGDRDTSRGALSGLLGVTVRPTAFASATLQYVRGFREPTLSDRYFRGVSGRGFVVGNPDLRPETSDQLDLALRAAFSERARLAAYGYLYRIHDVVERFREGSDFRFRNRGEQEVRGAELEAEWSASDALDFAAALSWARGRIVDDDSFAADVPAPAAVLTGRLAVTPRFWTRVRVRLVAEDDEPGPTEGVMPAHEVVDLSAGFSATDHLEVVVIGSNLTDERYPLSADADAPAAPGRGAAVTLQATW